MSGRWLKDYMHLENKSLGSIVTEFPLSTTIFRRYDLDYCCGGKKTLKDACAEKGISLDVIRTELVQVTAEKQDKGFESGLPARGITAFIEKRYHQDLRKRLPMLIELAEKVEKAHEQSPELPQGLSSFLKEFTAEMFEHMNKEEQILFPLIDAGHTKIVKMPITRMELEHEQHGKNLRRIKELTNNYKIPANACFTWTALYKGLEELELELMDHINLENNVLFPRALNALVP